MSICLAVSDANWALTKDVFSMVGAMVSAAAVTIAYYFGRQGMKTWKRQLKGSSDHELARKALIELFRYREAIERARSPVMFGFETELTEDEAKGLDFSRRSHFGKRKGYQKRFNRIAEAREPIHGTLLDSEAVWGKQLTALFKPLFSLQHEFYSYVESYLIATDPDFDDDYRRAYSDIVDGRRDVMYDALDELGDDYRKEFNSAVVVIEDYLRPKLISG